MHVQCAATQRLGQLLDGGGLSVAQRVDAEQPARLGALCASLVVAGAGELMALAGVEHDEPPVAEQQRHGLDVERAEVDAQRGVALAVQRRELVEQAGVRADPVVLHA